MTGDGDDEDIVTGTEGEGAEGQDTAGRDEDAEIPAEHPDDQEDAGEQDDAVAAEPAERPTRGGGRFQRLANERNAERERANRLEQELAESRRQQWQRQQAASEEERQARRALMTPEERVADDMAQMRREFATQRQQDQWATQAMLDKSSYDAKAAVNPVYAKHAEEIEAQFQDLLRQGRPVERQILLERHIGKLALSGAGNSKPRRQAQQRVASQRVPASSGKGDASSARGKAGDTAESRLKDVFI